MQRQSRALYTMAEQFQRNKLYEYRANSNLVLEADRESRRRTDEATGEVETLHGKLGSVRMGDRLTRDAKADLDDRIAKAKSKRIVSEMDEDPVKKKRRENKTGNRSTSILAATEDLDSVNYQPRTRESRVAYEEILALVQGVLGYQPQDIIRGAAEEVLSILKDDKLRDPERHREINKILSPIPTDRFNKFVNLGKQITDFARDTTEEEDVRMDDNMGVAVVFDDDDREVNADDTYETDEEEEEEEGVEAGKTSQLRGEDADGDGETEDTFGVSVHDIDAHWLQRQLSKYYTDANISAKLADDTLQALQLSDERQCENKLVVLLDFDKFDFIKLLLRNRAKIYYCSRLKQAQNDTERRAIEDEMQNDLEGAAILATLQQKASAGSWAKDRLGEFASKARKEARALSRAGKSSVVNDEVEDFIGVPVEAANGAGASPESVLDLESLEFAPGSHFMANKRCELPDKSWRAQKKGYEEVHVPAVRAIISSKEKLTQINDLPTWAQPAFEGVRALNRIQSRMVQAALHSSENILLCAPTGAGKTNVALMCMLNIIGQHLKEDGTVDLDAFKIVYVAPMKALVQEVVQNFGKKLAPFNITVRELSGDQNLTRQQIQETQLIVTTPEKWDIVTRKAGDRAYTQLVRLMIIDEIHLLHDERGPVLESLVARTLRQIETTQEMVRIVGLSATLPNYEDVAIFLRVHPEKGLFFFDSTFRPVPLQQQYIGITEKKALKRFQLMNEICYEKVLHHAGKNQVLIFTHSRAETAKTARALRDLALENDAIAQFVKPESASHEILREESASVKNPDLKDLLPHGFAIHHAGLVRSDRTLVEDLFSDKHVQVLVSTATLAWGVNLPAHTVILKGTQMYSPDKGRWVELSPLDVMQMMGRAGRYGLDSEGEGIIITAHSELQYYLSLMNQQLPIESQFIKKLPDMLNAEIVLGTVQSIREAATWLGYTYLYVRMLRNPALYGVTEEEQQRDETLFQRRMDLAHTAAMILDKHNLIKYDRKSGVFQVTALGRVASHYYVSHESVHVFNDYLKPSMTEIEIFRLFSLSGEFKNIFVREEEKLELMRLVTRVPIPVKEGIDEPSAKVNVLLQAYISRLKLDGFALVADMTYIQQSACRLMRALFEVALKRGWASLAEKTLCICKMIERRTWLSQSPLRQFSGIPEVIIRKLEKISDIPWERFYDLKPQDLGEMVKLPKMGKTLHKYIHMFPKIELSAAFQPITRSLLSVSLTLTPDFQFDTAVHDFAQTFWVLVVDVNGEQVLHHEPFILHRNHAAHPHTITFAVNLLEPMQPQYFIKVISDRWMHSETVLPVSFRHLLLPQKFSPPAELLDLQPLPISVLRNPKYEALYNFKFFNPIQTQVFTALYEGDDNSLICAPTGSGKTICAEFAMLRLFNNNPEGKCVYLAVKQDICDIMEVYLTARFQKMLGFHVVKLRGDTTSDLKLLEVGSIIIATAEQWDVLSRRWKQRKAIQNVSLYIADELHLMGGLGGSTLEVVMSRARYVASQLEKSVRIIGLSASIANAKDVGDWLSVSHHSLYNFAPSVRPVPMELHIHGFETNHFGTRLLAMSKPAFNSVTGHSPNKPALIFVPSRKQAQLTAIDMMTFAASSSDPKRFLRKDITASWLESTLLRIKEPALSQTLAQGVGFIHSGLVRSDRELVKTLFKEDVIRVLVVPHELCWSLATPAHLVVIMETTYYEGREHTFVDRSITDIMQMAGLASRPQLDDTGKVVVLCHAPKREYLKRFLTEALPIESHLDSYLHDHLNAEIVTKTIENKQDAVDYLTWTFYYRRLTQNPNYYNLQGVSHKHLSDHLSELIENTISDLEESKCIAVEDDIDLSPLNLGMIASYYYIQYTTIEMFAASVTAKTRLKGLLQIISSASEYADIAIRQGEEEQLKKISKHLPVQIPDTFTFDSPATKALVLLQEHFSRNNLPIDLNKDLKIVLNSSIKLLQALVDVISSQGWLMPALGAMVMSQMAVQGMWDKDSILLQIPHFTPEVVNRCEIHDPPIESVFDILELEDDVRNKLLQFTPEQMSDVAVFCNTYPSIDVNYETDISGDVGRFYYV